MVAFNFQPEFVPDIESGKKTQTIRQKAKGRAGDLAQLYTGQRTKACRKIITPDPTLILVDYVAIRPGYLTFGNAAKHPRDIDECAAMDGFASYKEMVQWFQDRYRVHSFVGFLHRWELPPGFIPIIRS